MSVRNGGVPWPTAAFKAGKDGPADHTVLEREIKLAVDALDPVRSRLQNMQARNLNVVFLYTVHEHNLVLDTANDDLKAREERLRIREIEGRSGVQVTWKGPPAMRGGVRRREEREFHADDRDACVTVLANLGLRPKRSYEKFRSSWKLDGVLVCLDTLPFGTFVEIEFTPDTPEGDEEVVLEKVISRLGLDGAQRVQASYARLQQEWEGRKKRR